MAVRRYRTAIEIDGLTEDELRDLHHRVTERLRMIQQLRAHGAMQKFSIGDRVSFEAEGRRIVGVITRYNKKTVTIIADGGLRWNVSPGFLQRVVKVEVEQEVGRPQGKGEGKLLMGGGGGERSGTVGEAGLGAGVGPRARVALKRRVIWGQQPGHLWHRARDRLGPLARVERGQRGKWGWELPWAQEDGTFAAGSGGRGRRSGIFGPGAENLPIYCGWRRSS